MENIPDFYLVPNECVPVVYPIKCWIVGTLHYENKDDYFIVDVNPQVIFYDKNKDIIETEKVILTARYQNDHIKMVKERSIFVNILWKKNIHQDLNLSGLSYGDVEIIALGKIYPTANSAWEDVYKAFEQKGKY